MDKLSNTENSSLTVGLVTTEYVTEKDFDGGLANYLHRLALSLKNLGHTPIIFVLSNKSEVIYHKDIEVHRIQFRGVSLIRLIKLFTFGKLNITISNFWLSWYLNFVIKTTIKSRKISILHYPSCAGLALFRIKTIPAVARISSYMPLWNQAYELEPTLDVKLSEKLEDIAYTKVDALIAPSNLNAKAVEKAIGRPVTVIETPFILNTTELDDTVYQQHLKDKKYLLFFGTIGLMKGCGLIADIIFELLDQYPDLYFTFVGKDTGYLGYEGESIMDRIRHNAKQHGDRVIHLDRLPHKYLYPIISHAYAVVLPSRVDNMPNTCLEAMGHKKIVIGTDGASFEQLIIDGVSGFLCRKDDPQSLLEKIKQVLALSAEEKSVIENNAHKRIQELQPEKVVKQLVGFYKITIKNFHEN